MTIPISFALPIILFMEPFSSPLRTYSLSTCLSDFRSSITGFLPDTYISFIIYSPLFCCSLSCYSLIKVLEKFSDLHYSPTGHLPLRAWSVHTAWSCMAEQNRINLLYFLKHLDCKVSNLPLGPVAGPKCKEVHQASCIHGNNYLCLTCIWEYIPCILNCFLLSPLPCILLFSAFIQVSLVMLFIQSL